VPEPATVALVNCLWKGHHPMFFAQLACSFQRHDARIVGCCPQPEDARREIEEAGGDPSRLHLETLDTGGRSWFGGRFEGDPLRTLRRWQHAAAALERAEAASGWPIELVFFPYLDSYLRFLPLPGVPARTIARPWSGLYLRNHHFGRHGATPLDHARLLAKGDAIFRSRLCRRIHVLDERFNHEIEAYTGRPVVQLPDVTQSLLPEREPELTRRVREAAAGRPIIGMIGLEKRKGVLNLMRCVERAAAESRPWFFVFGGRFSWAEFDERECAWIRSLLARREAGELDNFHFDPEAPRLPTEPDFNSLFHRFDVAWVAYENFHGSSGAQTKAAEFEIPIIATAGECIGSRVERYRTGLTIPERDPEAALLAIERLLAGSDANGRPLEPDYQGFREDHSQARLDRVLGELLGTPAEPAQSPATVSAASHSR